MRLEIFIAFRYLLSKGRKKGLISFANLIAAAGVFLGVMVPVIVMAVLSGFQKDMQKKILSLQHHIVIYPVGNKGISNYASVSQIIKQYPDTVSVAPVIESQGLIRLYDEYKPIMIRGVEPEIFTYDPDLSHTVKFLHGTNTMESKYSALIGNEIAKNYFISIGDRIEVISASSLDLFNTRPKVLKFQADGIFSSGYYEHDRGFLYVPLGTLQQALEYSDTVQSLGVKIKNIWEADNFANTLRFKFNNEYSIYSWKDLNYNIFKALLTERILLWIVVIFILIVSIFSVTASQIMLVLEKKRDIGILKTLGLTPGHIIRIFLTEGLVTTLAGAFPGAVCGVFFSANIKRVLSFIESIINFLYFLQFQIISVFTLPLKAKPDTFAFFPEGVYYLDTIPVDMNLQRVIIILAAAVCLSLVAGVVPAKKASGLKPIEVLRYE